MHELHGHGTLADGGRTALGRARSHVTGREDPGHARLEQVGGPGRVAGEKEAVGMPGDRLSEPAGARQRTEKQEEERERHPFVVLQRHGFELAVLSVERGDLGAVAHDDAEPFELVNEVVGHRLAQVRAPVEQCHERAAA